MKQRLTRILLGIVILGMTGITQLGCSTPTYSSKERFAQIKRNWGLEWQMVNEDVDHVLLLRPASGLTPWNVP